MVNKDQEEIITVLKLIRCDYRAVIEVQVASAYCICTVGGHV